MIFLANNDEPQCWQQALVLSQMWTRTQPDFVNKKSRTDMAQLRYSFYFQLRLVKLQRFTEILRKHQRILILFKYCYCSDMIFGCLVSTSYIVSGLRSLQSLLWQGSKEKSTKLVKSLQLLLLKYSKY